MCVGVKVDARQGPSLLVVTRQALAMVRCGVLGGEGGIVSLTREAPSIKRGFTAKLIPSNRSSSQKHVSRETSFDSTGSTDFLSLGSKVSVLQCCYGLELQLDPHQ